MPTSLLFSPEAGSGSDVLTLLGRLHPAVVHYPIALITVAAAGEGWQILRKRPEPAAVTGFCVVLGALGAIVSSFFGLLSSDGGDLAERHKWLGLAATAVTIAAAGLYFRVRACPWARAGMRIFLIGGAALIGITGYIGGDLVFGENHLFKGLFGFRKPVPAPVIPAAADSGKAPLQIPQGRPDFAKEVAPLITKLCLRCHGGEKVKGKLNLKTREGFLKGGGGGKVVVPGKPKDSPFYTSMLETDPEVKMPPPKEKVQPSKDDLELIRKWIEQGADWPAGIELK